MKKDSKTNNLENPEYWKSLINIGLSKFFVLKILYEGPAHGYGILKKLTELTEGCCTPTFGTIYPILKMLTEKGYTRILEESNTNQKRVKKIYKLTPKGRKAYRIALQTWRSVIPLMHESIDVEYEPEYELELVRGHKE